MFKKIFTTAWMAMLFACCQLAAAAPTVSVSATPSNPNAPATVTLAVTATSDGNPVTVTQVEYFLGSTSVGVRLQSPFTLTLNNVAAGTYQVTAKATATDPVNAVLQSEPLSLTVGAAPGAATAYFIHTDQLNTPRAISNGSGSLVWQWDSDPFGKDAANEQPASQPAFTFNLRFPGQQFDRESNLHYNYFRDYDPLMARYIQSDPIGLNGGVNTYGYVGANPMSGIDPLGLETVVTVWNGVGMGSSAFGHVSSAVNGRNYSWGPGGWDNVYPSSDAYNARQASFRSGTSYSLNLTADEEKELEQCLRAHSGNYNAINNNCTTAAQQCLPKRLGLPANRTFPGLFGDDMRKSPGLGGISQRLGPPKTQTPPPFLPIGF